MTRHLQGSAENDPDIKQHVRTFLRSPNVIATVQASHARQIDGNWVIDHYPQGCTPLHLAAAGGLSIIVADILQDDPCGRSMTTTKDSYGRLPLHQAIIEGQPNTTEVLLRHNNSVIHERDYEGMTPLHHAAVVGNQAILSLVLREGGRLDVNELDKSNNTPLERALSESREGGSTRALLDALITDGRDSLLKMNAHEWNALHVAAFLGDRNATEKLLELRVKIGDREVQLKIGDQDRFGNTPVHKAAQFGHVEVLELLLSKVEKGKFHVLNSDLQTPLHFAASYGKPETVDVLLKDYKADASVYDYRGWAPIHWAAVGGHYAIVLKLYPVTEDLESKGKVLLHLAMWGGDQSVIAYLSGRSAKNEDLNMVFQISNLCELGRRKTSVKEKDIREDGSKLLQHIARNHVFSRNFRLASVCFDLGILIHPDYNPSCSDVNKISHPTIYCNLCRSGPQSGYIYRSTGGSSRPPYFLCSACFNKKLQDNDILLEFIRIPSRFPLPAETELLESLKIQASTMKDLSNVSLGTEEHLVN